MRFDLVAVNLDQKQPGFPRARAARLPDGARRAVPRHRAGHVSRREARDSRGSHDVRTVLAAAARCAVSLRLGERHHEGGARAPSRRHRRDAVPEHVLRRPHEDDAAEAALGRRPAHRDPAAWPTCRSARSNAMRAPGSFRIIPCTLCGSQQHLQRVIVKKMLTDWEREFPGRTEAIFSSLSNVTTRIWRIRRRSISRASRLAAPRRSPPCSRLSLAGVDATADADFVGA